MPLPDSLPHLNATLNAASACLLVAGWRAIKTGRVQKHRARMLAALFASALFLVFYLIRFAATGVHRYPRTDWTRIVYFMVLGSHTVLAAAILPLVATTIYLAARQRFAQHQRLARWTFPIWLYVSATGVVVYLMLYQLAGA